MPSFHGSALQHGAVNGEMIALLARAVRVRDPEAAVAQRALVDLAVEHGEEHGPDAVGRGEDRAHRPAQIIGLRARLEDVERRAVRAVHQQPAPLHQVGQEFVLGPVAGVADDRVLARARARSNMVSNSRAATGSTSTTGARR